MLIITVTTIHSWDLIWNLKKISSDNLYFWLLQITYTFNRSRKRMRVRARTYIKSVSWLLTNFLYWQSGPRENLNGEWTEKIQKDLQLKTCLTIRGKAKCTESVGTQNICLALSRTHPTYLDLCKDELVPDTVTSDDTLFHFIEFPVNSPVQQELLQGCVCFILNLQGDSSF